MSFTGKCTFTGGSTLPEIAEDVSDLVSILAPYETPLLDLLGDPHRVANSTRHEWFEDTLLPNTDTINTPGLNDSAMTTTAITVANASRFRIGDLVRDGTSREILLVTAVNTGTNQITIVRGYGASPKSALANSDTLQIISNAALEGQDAPDARFSIRVRQSNFTQIFATSVQVSGSEAAVRQLAVDNELDYQKTNRLREMLRDLESTVINGIAQDSTPVGGTTVRRTMRGLLASIQTNIFVPGVAGFPSDSGISEDGLNQALRSIWSSSGAKVDTILCGGAQKRHINEFIADTQRFGYNADTFRSSISVYESDFGVCRIVLSRDVPADTILLLDSSRISVLPLAGRSFQFKPLATTGDYEAGELIGEYTMELRNETAHAMIRGLTMD